MTGNASGEHLATRVLVAKKGGEVVGEVTLFVDPPRPAEWAGDKPEDSDFSCRCGIETEIEALKMDQDVHGVDGLQALELAIKYLLLRCEGLEQKTGYSLDWPDEEEGDGG